MNDMIVGFLFGVVGTLVGVLFTHFLSKGREWRKDFNNAAERYIFAFQDELSRLKHSRETTIAIIQPAIFKHQTATSIFKRWLPCNRQGAFDLAWKDYLIAAPSQYEKKDQEINWDEENKYCILLIEKIEKLLDFAKFK